MWNKNKIIKFCNRWKIENAKNSWYFFSSRDNDIKKLKEEREKILKEEEEKASKESLYNQIIKFKKQIVIYIKLRKTCLFFIWNFLLFKLF